MWVRLPLGPQEKTTIDKLMATFQELLKSVSDSEIYSALSELYNNFEFDEYKGKDGDFFKLHTRYPEAINYLRNIKQDPDKHWRMSLYDDFGATLLNPDDPDYHYSLGGCPWNYGIEQEVLIPENRKSLSQAQIVAVILYEMTFYGYTPSEIEENLMQIEYNG